MSQHSVITLPGPGGSTISCCIIPCGCILVLLIGIVLGGAGLLLRLHARSQGTAVTAAARMPRPAGAVVLPGR